MEANKKRWLIVLGGVFLIGLIMIVLVLGWFARRGEAFESRPLVLIHEPATGDQSQVGSSFVVHATAREEQGLSRIELWVNDQLIESQESAEEDISPTNMTLLSGYTPTYEGEHLIVVRAISSQGISGQSSIAVRVSLAEDLTYIVEEGDTLESIAIDYDTSPEELIDANPDLGEGGPEAGDELIVPGGEPAGEEEPVPDDEGSDAPLPEGDEPLIGWTLPFWFFTGDGDDSDNVTLRLEVPALRTSEGFTSLHCYVSLADSLPQWYPDWDNNQSTDESFEAGTDGWWITEDALEGDAAPLISWPVDQPIPFSIACVGVSGGTEALEFGVIDIEIPPEQWDGNRQDYETEGEGGHLFLQVKVTQTSGDPRYAPKYPDPDMTKPTNVRLNDEEQTLEWDYLPEEDEEAIDGFRIYLNGNLQWSVSAEARSTRLPSEWFRPPCAWTYTFGVTAYRIEFPDGPESDPPSTVDRDQPREECMRIMRVTFVELQTFDLGGDGRYEDRHGDVGPAYGTFFANHANVSFDHGHEGRGLDMPEGLRHNTTYNLAEVSGDVAWHFTGSNSLVTEVPYGGELHVGFRITDRDTGSCHDSGDRGCDDLICDGAVFPIQDIYGQLDGLHRETITSENGRCRVTFEYEPTEDSPVGERYIGAEPLPWVDVVEFYIDDETGRAHLAVGNSGTAAWAERDLMIELQTRDGDSLGIAAFEDFSLSVGETRTLDHPLFVVDPPYDACVVIDPFDEVLELYERTETLVHNPVCPDLPDLEVESAYFSTQRGNNFIVNVRNNGDGPLAYRDLVFEFRGMEDRLVTDPATAPDAAIAAGRTERFEIPVGDTVNRIELSRGWSVTLNPSQIFVESDYSNNTFELSEGAEIELNWYAVRVPYGLRNDAEIFIDVYIREGRMRSEHVVDMGLTQDIDWGTCPRDYGCSLHFSHPSLTSAEFLIIGGEELEVVIEIKHPGTLWANITLSEVFSEPDWEGGGLDMTSRSCSYWPTREDIGRHSHVWRNGSSEWWVRYDLCKTEID